MLKLHDFCNRAIDCNAGPGWGGRGGNAGAGGLPGIGGNGSDAPAVYLFVSPAQVPVADAISYSAKGGIPGMNGRRGQAGTPGRGGAEGNYGGNCHSAGRQGQDGIVPPLCAIPDVTGRPGKDGVKPAVTEYTGFRELDI